MEAVLSKEFEHGSFLPIGNPPCFFVKLNTVYTRPAVCTLPLQSYTADPNPTITLILRPAVCIDTSILNTPNPKHWYHIVRVLGISWLRFMCIYCFCAVVHLESFGTANTATYCTLIQQHLRHIEKDACVLGLSVPVTSSSDLASARLCSPCARDAPGTHAECTHSVVNVVFRWQAYMSKTKWLADRQSAD